VRASLLGQRRLGPERVGETAARAGGKRAASEGWAAGLKAERDKKNSLFFFLFKCFKAFSNYFESSFEFESNHSLQYSNATT
jgi:hypothetical protein